MRSSRQETYHDIRELFNERALVPARTIHHATDVQYIYCSPAAGIAGPEEKLDEIALYIVSSVAPAFKKAGIDTYWLWMSKANEPGFYFSETPAGDKIIRKTARSSFQGSLIDDMLRERGIDTVLVSGFYANECLWESAYDSTRHGYRTVILADCIDLKNMTARQKEFLERKGAVFSTSAEVLDFLRAAP